MGERQAPPVTRMPQMLDGRAAASKAAVCGFDSRLGRQTIEYKHAGSDLGAFSSESWLTASCLESEARWSRSWYRHTQGSAASCRSSGTICS